MRFQLPETLLLAMLLMMGFVANAQTSDAEEAVPGDQHQAPTDEEGDLQTMQGTVLGRSGQVLTLSEEEARVPLQLVAKDTGAVQVEKDGEPIGFEALQPGDEIRASYVTEGEVRVLRTVEVERR